MKRFYFYSVARSADPAAPRNLWAYEAKDEKDASEHLFRQHGQKPFHAIGVGSFTSKELTEALLPPHKTGDPLNTLNALKYIETEYAEPLGEHDARQLKRIRNKLFKHLIA